MILYQDSNWLRQSHWPNYNGNRNKVKIADLFCGCGGLTLGAMEALRLRGFTPEIAFAIDINDSALGVYRENFGRFSNKIKQADITRYFRGKTGLELAQSEKELLSDIGKIDILLAGPPCQGHSDLNNSTRRHDPRNSLYFRVVRAAEIFKPRFLIIENVPSVIHDKGKVVARSCSALQRLGYFVSTCVINAADLGLAQSRKRHIIVASNQIRFDLNEITELWKSRRSTVCDYIGDLESFPDCPGIFDTSSQMRADNIRRTNFLFDNNLYDLPDNLRPPCHRDKHHSYVSMYGRLRWDGLSQTITSGFGSMGQGRFLHPSARRTITPHEAARLQGFPDFFSFRTISSRTSIQKVIGNAVPPCVAYQFVSELFQNQLDSDDATSIHFHRQGGSRKAAAC